MVPASSTPPDDEDLFDLWLDQALLGEVEDPAAFCARHGAGPEVARAAQSAPLLLSMEKNSRNGCLVSIIDWRTAPWCSTKHA